MKLTSESFEDGEALPEKVAFCAPDPENHARMSDNHNPQLAWDGLPDGTKSLALICHDPDVPSVGDDVNQEGKTVPADLDRVDFFHWVLVDLDPDADPIAAGEFSKGVTPRGKEGPGGPRGTRSGINDYTNWFADDPEMAGDYYGYDGPCPPWNDSIVHHYHFTLYALDCEKAPVDGKFTGEEVRDAIEDHVLAKASIVGLYSLNPDVSV